MNKELVSEEHYINLLNEELKKHTLYKKGMKVVPAPEGARGRNITGYRLIGGDDWPIVLADTAHIISQKYGLKIN